MLHGVVIVPVSLFACETLSLTLKKSRKLTIFESEKRERNEKGKRVENITNVFSICALLSCTMKMINSRFDRLCSAHV